jgi:HK97 gp10 family phage protein
MARFKVTLNGFREMSAKLKNLPKEITKEIDAELQDGTAQMRDRAKNDAPKDQGLLIAEIVNKKESPLNWSVVSQADYSAFVEFGTRSKVQIPAGVEGSRFSKSSSLSAKEAIYAWCKRKGIEEKYWFPIYRQIMTRGSKPHPFFFKQLDVVAPELLRNIQNVLDDQRLD